MLKRGLWCLLFGLIINSPVDGQDGSRPNVLLIMTDDQGWGDLSLHGNPDLETPRIDALAKEGAQFRRFYVSPLCAPTRASLLTGKYHLRTGTVSVSKGLEIMRTEETTLAEMFKGSGYRTGCFGKWHNGEHIPNDPNSQGFDEFFGFMAGHWSNYFDTDLNRNGKKVRTKGYISDVLTDAAIHFMEKNRHKPFFCYVPYNAPHTPHQAPVRYFTKYKNKGLDDEKAAIYAMCENLDDNIGRLLDRLTDLGLDKNTIVIFLTDNGPNGVRFNGGMKGIKGTVYEGGIRVPCFIRWPGRIEPGRSISGLAAHIDWLPTLSAMCGLQSPLPANLDGRDLSPSIFRGVVVPERTLFTHVAFLDPVLKPFPGSVRTDQYQLAVFEDKVELYDMIADPGELKNIAGERPEATRQLKAAYDTWFSDATKFADMTRRIPVAGNQVDLPGYEALFSGGVRFMEGHGWAHDWLTGWKTPADTIWWEVDCAERTTFNVWAEYTCPESAVGMVLTVGTPAGAASGEIKTAFDPPVIPSPDLVPRKEAFEKQWNRLKIGSVTVPEGRQRITLALQIPEIKAPGITDASRGIDINSLILKKRGPSKK